MLKYIVEFAAPATHHAEVTIEIDGVSGPLTLWMPTWAPGSYLIREFGRNLRDIRATDANGASLPVERVDKASFRVAEAAGRVVIRYGLFLFERTVRTSYVDDRQAMLNGSSVFLAVEGRERDPHHVEVRLPEGWTVDTGLKATSAADARFVADDYDHLIDAPIQCGLYERIDFQAAGKPHRIALVGGGNHDSARLARDAAKIVEVAAGLFGGVPYDDYLFILQTGASGAGGLEHRNSSVLQCTRFSFQDERSYHDLLTLIAHEHFHVWNVKRILPREFVPYDLRNETYTRSLWVCEGITSYYDELLPVRAGLVTPDKYRERVAEEITRYRQSPGSRAQDLEESSLTTWIRLYRPDEDTVNSAISYYRKGALVAMLLDLEVRRRSDGARSLDDVMRALHERYGPGTPGFSRDEFESLASEVAGHSLAEFFDHAVRGTGELDFSSPLRWLGLDLAWVAREPDPTAYDLVGLRIPEGETLRIDGVDRGSPAEAAGLSARDEIVALDGFRVVGAALAKRLREAKGRRVDVTYFRDDRLCEASLAIPATPSPVARITVGADGGADENARRCAWLGVEQDPPKEARSG